MLNKILITIYTAFLLLMPEGITFGWFSYSKILLILSVIIIIYKLLDKKTTIKNLNSLKNNKVVISLLCVAIFIFISNLINYIINKDMSLSDTYEILRPVLYFFVFIIYYLFFKTDRKYLIKTILIMVFLNCILSITQYYDLFKMNELYITKFAPTQYDALINGYKDPRVVGFTSNPNVYGFFITIFAIFTLYLTTECNGKLKNKVLLYILLLLEVLNVIMTMSRTSFICLALGLLIFIVIYNLKNNNLYVMIKKVGIYVVCFILLFLVLPNENTWRIKQLVNINSVRTWQQRVKNNEKSSDIIFNDNSINQDKTENETQTQTENKTQTQTQTQIQTENKPQTQTEKISDSSKAQKEMIFHLIIGHGSSKLVNNGIHDNEYMLIIYRYGFIGTLVISLTYILIIFQLKNIKSFSLVFTLAIVSLIYMYPASLYHSYKLYPIIMIIYAYSYVAFKEYNPEKKKIVMIATYFPPSGGVGVFRITKFAKYLKRKGYCPVVVTADNKYCINYDESLLEDINNIKVYRIDFKCKKNKVAKYFTKQLKSEIDNIIEIEKPELLFLTGGPFQALNIGRYVYNQYDIPYIVDLRDPWFLQTFPKLKIKNILGRFNDLLHENYVFKKAKNIILINNELYEKYAKFYPRYKKKFKIISNGYDEDDYKNLDEIKFQNFTIGYAGKYSQMLGERNPTNLFKVITKLNREGLNIDYVSIGKIEDNIIKISKDNECFKYCKFLGFKSHKETLTYQKNFDVNIVLTTNKKVEQTGKIFDLINLKKPVIIITNIESNLTRMCDGIDYIKVFRYDDLEGIENYIKNLYNNEEKYTYINSFEFSKYDRSCLTDELIRLIEK